MSANKNGCTTRAHQAREPRASTEVRSTARSTARPTARPTAIFLVLLLLSILLSLSAVACSSEQDAVGTTSTSTSQQTVTITDHAGRQVTIPAHVGRVFGSGPTATNLIYTLAPELLIGWNITPTEQEKEYIPAEYRTMVGLGGWFGKNTTGNVEEIIKLAPDVVVSLGSVDEAAVSDAERIQGLLGVPVVLVDSTLAKTGEAYRFIGEMLGVQERAEKLAIYSDEVVRQAEENAAKLTEAERISIYYAEGGKGLHTDPEGSDHTEVFSMVGAKNVADVELQQGYGMSPVSLEQVIAWNPQAIFVASDPAGETNVHEQITTGADWATIQAVKDGRVYEIPHGPFDWVDRPYSIGRILGIPWVGNLLYPELYDFDMQAKVKEFYELFYHFDLTDEQMQRLMEHAVPTNATAGSETTTTAAAATASSSAGTSGNAAVKGMVDNPTALTAAKLETMTVTEITVEHPKLGMTDYRGVRLSDLFAALGVQSEATTLVMTASDAYMAEVPLSDIQGSTDAILAIGDDGRLSVVIPGIESKSWVKDVVSLEFK